MKLDRKIYVYFLENYQDEDGNTLTRKNYIIPQGGYLKASYRALSASEVVKMKEQKEDCTCQFDINPRSSINTDCFVEFSRPLFGLRTYSITGIDTYDEKKRTRWRLRAREVTPEQPDEIRWGVVHG